MKQKSPKSTFHSVVCSCFNGLTDWLHQSLPLEFPSVFNGPPIKNRKQTSLALLKKITSFGNKTSVWNKVTPAAALLPSDQAAVTTSLTCFTALTPTLCQSVIFFSRRLGTLAKVMTRLLLTCHNSRRRSTATSPDPWTSQNSAHLYTLRWRRAGLWCGSAPGFGAAN